MMIASRAWIAIGVAFSLQAYVLYYSFHYGVLSGLLQWDDCAVILRGFENLEILAQAKSIMAALQAALHFKIHAPVSDVQTMVGLLLSGGQIWGPYLLNACWLALVLTAVLMTVDRQDWRLGLAIVLLIVVQPLTINALTYDKSDWKGGILLAGAIFLLYAGAQRGRVEFKLLGATLLGLSILTKLTAFYLPVLAVAILLLFEWYSANMELRRRSGSAFYGTINSLNPFRVLELINLRLFTLCALIATCPFLLFFAWKIRPTLTYIRDAATDVEWRDGYTILQRAAYYSPLGRDSWMEWGNLHIALLVFVGVALCVAWIRRGFGYFVALCVLAVIGALFFVPLIVLKQSNLSYAATFLGVILAASLVSMDFIARSLPRWGGWAVVGLAVLISVPTQLAFRNTAYYSMFVVSNDELRQLADTYGRIVDAMVEHAQRDRPHVVVFYDHLFAPHPNVAIEFFQKTGRLPTVERVDDIDKFDPESQLASADFALTIAPSVKGAAQSIRYLYPGYPISRDPGAADGVVQRFGTLHAIGTFPVVGGEIHLYGK